MIVLWTAPQGGMCGLGLERAAASEAHCLGGLQQADHTGRLPSRWVGHVVVDFPSFLVGHLHECRSTAIWDFFGKAG